ncbi:general transcription factor II-I repeat domain-containing protein 2-like [Neoarius graeffei]|uniref:general transcription factor II-I repeat domain-containing protein 2-like n=1 Tax=Neoarius graeffei TaxID=443677 RepID=UPI00298CF60E|nr:general transcription factor II-I repeat domain-containing protein 2-like [Neoarius graeffei]XP_060788260.1 general transcription factor II-I repeat domain-containing protein 2-like [Neoarius graeffei]
MDSKGKKRKIADENRGFKEEWTDAFAFIANAEGLPACLICNEKLSNNKKSNLERHFQLKHAKFAADRPVGTERKGAIAMLVEKFEGRENSFKKWITSPNSTTTASFVAAREIIRCGKPFTDGEYMKESLVKISEHLFSDFKNKTEIIQKIKDMPLSAKTVKDRANKMANNITDQQIKDINSAPAYSIACDESCDVTDIEQTAVLCRYVNSDGPQEEMIGLMPLKGQTRGEDICEAVLQFLNNNGINTNHLISVATDGAPSMRGSQRGFVTLLQKALDRHLLVFHCILHQEALCAQTFPPECMEVMNLVIQIVNKIIAKALNHRQFRELHDEADSEYADLLLHNKVRWLSRGDVLCRFVACLEHVKTFLKSKDLSYPQLEDTKWLEKLHFMVDMTRHLNTLNKSLQERGNTALQMLEAVLSFERKLAVFARDVQRGTLSHFSSLREFKDAHQDHTLNGDYLQGAIVDMQAAFGSRFSEFRKEKMTLSFPVTPLEIDPSLLNTFPGVNQADLEMEMADIADKDLWVAKFKSLTAELEDVSRQKAHAAQNHKWSDIESLPTPEKLVFETWKALPDT